DLVHGHVGGLDTLARGLKAAAALIEDGTFDKALDERYAGWKEREAKAMLSGKRSLEQIAARVEKQNINPQPRSGRQEYLENLVHGFVSPRGSYKGPHPHPALGHLPTSRGGRP